MNGILAVMRVLAGSAFVAAPLGRITLAPVGADVIRFDPIARGLDYPPRPVNDDALSLFFHRPKQAPTSLTHVPPPPLARPLPACLT